MDYLWSPWRMKYIMQNENNAGCVFCKALEVEDGINNLVVARGEHVFVIMNRFPYTSGHIMVVPKVHQPSFEDVDAATRTELMEIVTNSMKVLRNLYNPEGFNVGSNLGAAAGAGIADHCHFHIVPRWVGDTNFMSTLAGTRVLPESLEDTYQRLRQAWKQK
jgi:ATP adenylyltransferase